MGAAKISLIICLVVFAGLAPIFWTVRRVLRPIDQAAKARNAPFRFSIGDFLCLFWIVQLPLAFVFQLEGEETADFYWVLTATVWGVAPIVWIACARALSKAGISAGMHRFIFLGIVVPTVYYGLFPFIALQCVGLALLLTNGLQVIAQNQVAARWWIVLAIALVISGFYSPWVARKAILQSRIDDLDDAQQPLG